METTVICFVVYVTMQTPPPVMQKVNICILGFSCQKSKDMLFKIFKKGGGGGAVNIIGFCEVSALL